MAGRFGACPTWRRQKAQAGGLVACPKGTPSEGFIRFDVTESKNNIFIIQEFVILVI
jgi:hypothetical protein